MRARNSGGNKARSLQVGSEAANANEGGDQVVGRHHGDVEAASDFAASSLRTSSSVAFTQVPLPTNTNIARPGHHAEVDERLGWRWPSRQSVVRSVPSIALLSRVIREAITSSPGK